MGVYLTAGEKRESQGLSVKDMPAKDRLRIEPIPRSTPVNYCTTS